MQTLQAKVSRLRNRVIDDEDWCKILERAVRGESIRSIADEYKISEGTLRARGIVAQKEGIQDVASRISDAQSDLRSMPALSRIVAVDLANELISISTHLASAAKYGSMTAHRLASIAHDQAQSIDSSCATTTETRVKLRTVAEFTSTANEAGKLGTSLLTANKEQMRDALANVIDLEPKMITDDPFEASKTYQRLINGRK